MTPLFEANSQEYYLDKCCQLETQKQDLLAFVRMVATGKRPDGTYNYCREALETRAKEILKQYESL